MPTSRNIPLLQPQPRRLPVMQGLELWYSADVVPNVQDGVGVPIWPDLSPNKRDAVQTTSGSRPLWKENIINGKAVLRFDGTDDWMITPTFDLSFTPAVTLFAVFSASSGADEVVFEFSTNINSFTDGFLLYRDSSDKVISVHRGSAGGSGSNFVSTATLTTTPAVISAVYDKSLATNEATNWINGTSAGTRGANANNTGNFGVRAGYIGRRAGTSLPLNGDIGTLIVYSRALSDAERVLMETYLS